MHALPRILPIPLIAALSGCVLDPEVIGATLPTAAPDGPGDVGDASATNAGSDGETGTTDPTTGEDGVSDTSAAPEPGAYGGSCELAGLMYPPLDTDVTPQPACEGGICSLVQDDLKVCQTDEQCPDSVCSGNTFCELSPAFIAANSRCTRTCESVDDCPPMFGCQTGVTCTVLTISGDLCCVKMCACRDHISGILQAANQSTCVSEPEVCML